MPISLLRPQITKPIVAVLLGLMLLGGAAMLFWLPAHRYAVTCTKAQQISCAIERATSGGTESWQVPLGTEAVAVARVEPRRRGANRVFLYLDSGSRHLFAAEFEGASAVADADAAAARLNQVFASNVAATARIEARAPFYLRWLAWGALGVMALLVLAVYRELYGRTTTRLPRSLTSISP